MLRFEHVDDRACKFDILSSSDSGIANAIRRSLLNDVPSFAPTRVTLTCNTSCQTDEYIAHRIGLIPFRCTLDKGAVADAFRRGDGGWPTLSLSVSNRTAYAHDFEGSAFVPVFDVPILKMMTGQRIACTVEFEYATSKTHVRHSHIGPVKYSVKACADASQKCTAMGFETFVQQPLAVLDAALDAIGSNIDSALGWVEAHQESFKCPDARGPA